MAKEKDVRKLATDIRHFKSNLERYLEDSQKELSRYRSWEHCYVQFQKAIISRKVDRDMLCLWLAWYLASWGMLHNSELLNNNYKIHRSIVDAILNMDKKDLKLLNNLKCQDWLDDKENCRNKLNELYQEIRDKYEALGVTGTDTLVTKVLLGTLGCIPAFDNLFKEGISGKANWHRRTLAVDYVTVLCKFYEKNENSINKTLLSFHSSKGKATPYPQMKILDMGFWKKEK